MNNLLQFVIRYSAFILFLLLEAAALTLVVKYNENQKGIYEHSSSVISGKLYKMADDVYQYNHLQTFVDSLANENAALKEKVFNLERSVQRLLPADKPLDSCILNSYHLISAQIINNSINQRNNHFTIDRGKKDGIKNGMGVISEQGIVGIIDEAGREYSTAVSILHSAVQISAAIKRNGYFGSLVWKETDPGHMVLEAIPGQADIQIGDTIITSGYSFIFPRGIYIGKVEQFWTEGGSNYYTIKVRLHEDIARMNRVYIVEYLDENLMKDEQ
jgi:rod shape-determining protein MreC